MNAVGYQVQLGKKLAPVPASRVDRARSLDRDGNHIIDEAEIESGLRQLGVIKAGSNASSIVRDYAVNLSGQPSPKAALYPTLPEVEQQLHDWADQHADITSLVSIGKTEEGRDIWALKIGKDNGQNKPGLLVTGTTHAREWNTLSVAMNVAQQLVDGYSKDAQATDIVDKGEVWVVPCLNPDGYSYTRETDNMWRKNRRPVTPADNGCPGREDSSVGVDLNRNYWDGNPEHLTLYRPEGDTPCSTDDDSGPGYDDPTSDNYRGPGPASEKEVQSVANFFLQKPNVLGVVDHHSYGGDIFYPVPHDDPAAARYQEIAAGMNAVMEKPYKVLSCTDIPIPMGYYSGVAPFMWNANGKTAFLIEMGTEFQPGQPELESSVRDLTRADLSFADYLIRNSNNRR